MSTFEDLLTALKFTGSVGASLGVPLPELHRQVNTAFYTQLLIEHKGNRTKAARAAGRHRNSLLKVLNALRIPKSTGREEGKSCN